MKQFILIGILAICITLLGCQKKENPNEIRVGVIAGPEAELMETAKQVAANRYGLNIKIIEFSDYTIPNEALATGNIAANAFQHLPYLQAAIKAEGYQLTPIAKTFIYPMAIYSKKIKKIADLPDNAIVAIPNDPSNEARALFLLQQANLIQLKPNVGFTATPEDIISNPKKLVFKEIDAAQIPRIFADADLAAINTSYINQLGLTPAKDGLIIENANSPYTNLIVVRTDHKDDPRFAKLVKAYQSPEVEKKAQQLFKGNAIPGWK